MRFDNSLVVLTGVGRVGQVGEAVGLAFAEAGAAVAAVARTAAEAEARAAELRALGASAAGFGCDLTDAAQVAALATAVRERFGASVGALVNLAGGYAYSGPVAESDVAGWHAQFAMNLTTAYLATRAFLPLLRAARGTVVFFSSQAALPGGRAAGHAAYAAAKSGVLALMRAVAEEEGAHGVRANTIAPGTIRTAANVAALGHGAPYVERDDVARLVLHLSHPQSAPITGQTIALG